jgi:uncharacterized membrane protein
MKNLLKAFITMALCTLTSESFAQLNFQNNTNEPVIVTFAMQSNVRGFNGWISQGWYTVNPREKVMLSSSAGVNDNVYYYAITPHGYREFKGDQPFLTNKDGSTSTIRNADMEYVKSENPNYDWKLFRHVVMPSFRLGYTINLSY